MRKLCSVVSLVLAVGLGLLLVVPTSAQFPGEGSMSGEVYGYIDKGYAFLMEGKYDAAAMEFKKATQLDNTNPFALNNLAAIESQKGNLREAMALLQQATIKADKYKEKVGQTCFVAGLCNAVKPKKELGPTSTIAPIVQDNIAKLKPKLDAMPPSPTEPPKIDKK